MNNNSEPNLRYFVIGEDDSDVETIIVPVGDFGITEVVVKKDKTKQAAAPAQNNTAQRKPTPNTAGKKLEQSSNVPDIIEMALKRGYKKIQLSEKSPNFNNLLKEATKHGLKVIVSKR